VPSPSPCKTTPNYNPHNLKVGDQAAYYIVENSGTRADVYIHQGVIAKIENGRATLQFPNRRANTLWLQKLDFRGPSHALSRAMSRRKYRMRRGRNSGKMNPQTPIDSSF
jgi:hypothetical protein